MARIWQRGEQGTTWPRSRPATHEWGGGGGAPRPPSNHPKVSQRARARGPPNKWNVSFWVKFVFKAFSFLVFIAVTLHIDGSKFGWFSRDQLNYDPSGFPHSTEVNRTINFCWMGQLENFLIGWLQLLISVLEQRCGVLLSEYNGTGFLHLWADRKKRGFYGQPWGSP